MKKNNFNFLIIYKLLLFFGAINIFAKEELIDFSFEKKKLIDIIDNLASIKKINIIYPQSSADLEEFKNQIITYLPEKKIKINIETAWNILGMYLEMSGFSIYKKNKNLFGITKTGKSDQSGISREILPLYVDTKIDDLPNNSQRIIYLYFLKNLKAPKEADLQESPINKIISDMLSNGSPKPIYLHSSNGFLISDQANVIASIINIIEKIDKTGLKQVIEVIPIYNLNAQEVAKIFDTLKKAAGEEQNVPFIRYDPKESLRTYFSSDTQIIANKRDNSLILMGAESSINKIKDFITEKLDIPIGSGNSILHQIDLNFLDNKTFAPILQDIVNPIQSSSDGQVQQSFSYGPNRNFQGVIVSSEELVEIKQIEGVEATREVEVVSLPEDSKYEIKGITQKRYMGGNKIIVAAIQDDWIQIKNLISKLDINQPQVFLQSMIVDFRRQKNKQVASDLRNLTSFNVDHPGVQFLASHISNPNIVLGNTPQQLAQDLLAITGPNTVPALAPSGSTLISYNDRTTPGIFGLLQILSKDLNFKVISTPSVITLNKSKGIISQELTKRVKGDVVTGENQNFEIPIEDLSEIIKLEFSPSIASADKLKLSVRIEISEFISTSSLTRLTKLITTTATLENNQILAIGGLLKDENTEHKTYTPIVGKIPILGSLFNGLTNENIINDVVILIQPTILMPKKNSKLIEITKDKLKEINHELKSSEFIDFKDPIDRIFINNKSNENDNLMLEYLESTNVEIDKLDLRESKKSSLLTMVHKEPIIKNYDKIKRSIAFEKNPLSRIKLAQSKSILNC